MKITVFFLKLGCLFARSTQFEVSLARLPYRCVATLENVKRILHLLHMIELHRFPFVEPLEISWVDEVTHCQTINAEECFLDHVAYLVSIKRPFTVLTPKVLSRID